jgi:nicotinamidase-related amidase
MTNRALVVIDVQNDYFPGGRYPLVGIDAAAAQVARALATARTRGDTVIHVRHEAIEADAPFFVAGTPGAAIHALALPHDHETVVVKHQVNAFRDTPLGTLLAEHGIGHLTIVGAMSHMCIDAATRAAADLGYAVTLLHDACATRDLAFDGRTAAAADVQTAFMAALDGTYAKVISTDAWLRM